MHPLRPLTKWLIEGPIWRELARRVPHTRFLRVWSWNGYVAPCATGVPRSSGTRHRPPSLALRHPWPKLSSDQLSHPATPRQAQRQSRTVLPPLRTTWCTWCLPEGAFQCSAVILDGPAAAPLKDIEVERLFWHSPKWKDLSGSSTQGICVSRRATISGFWNSPGGTAAPTNACRAEDKSPSWQRSIARVALRSTVSFCPLLRRQLTVAPCTIRGMSPTVGPNVLAQTCRLVLVAATPEKSVQQDPRQ